VLSSVLLKERTELWLQMLGAGATLLAVWMIAR
jgi:hypothetical protein